MVPGKKLDSTATALGTVLLVVLAVGGAPAADADPAAAVARALPQLASPDRDVRQAAIWDLGRAGPAAAPAAESLAKLLSDPDDSLRWSAAWALTQLGEAGVAPAARLALVDDVRTRRAATYVLARLVPNSPAALRALLLPPDDDPLVRIQRSAWYRQLSPRHRELRGELIARKTSPQTLAALGPVQADELPQLVALLDDREVATRVVACRLLQELGPAAKAAVPRLMQELANPSSGEAAVQTLVAIGPAAEPAAARVMEVLATLRETPHARLETLVAALVPLKADPRRAAPLLLELLSEHDFSVSGSPFAKRGCNVAVEVLGALGGELPDELLARLRSESPNVRWVAARAVGHFGARGVRAVPELVRLLKDEHPRVQAAAVAALGQIGPAAKEAIEPLAELARKSPRPNNGEFYVHHPLLAMGRIGPAALPALRKFLHHEEPLVRQRAIAGIVELGPAAKEAVADLIFALEDPSPSVWHAAVGALGELGPAAQQGVTPLAARLAKATRQYEWRAILAALNRIAPEDEQTRFAMRESPLLQMHGSYREDALEAALRAGAFLDDNLWDYLDLRRDTTAIDAALAPVWGQKKPILLRGLADAQSATRRGRAARALAHVDLARDEAALAALVEAWADPEFKVREAVKATLTAALPSCVTPLVGLLRSPAAQTRTHVRELLGVLTFQVNEPARREVIEALSRLAGEPGLPDRERLVPLLDRLKPSLAAPPRALPDLVADLTGPAPRSVTHALRELSLYGAAAAPTLARLLDPQQPEATRRLALISVAQFKEHAWECLPALRALEMEPDAVLRMRLEPLRQRALRAVGAADTR